MLAFIVLLAILFFVVVGVETVARSSRLPIEVTRKFTHISVGVIVAFSTQYVAREYLVALAIMFLIVIVISKRRGVFRSIHDPNRSGVGEYWYPVGILLAVLLFDKPDAEAYAILILAVSDGLAGLIGKMFGKARIPRLSTPKTYLGTTVFVVSALIISLFFVPVPVAFGAALLLGAIELLGFKGLDNLFLPVVAGAIATIFAA